MTWANSKYNSISKISELCSVVRLSEDCLLNSDANSSFRLKVPSSFAARMQPGNSKDPLLLQILPSIEEQRDVTGFSGDPLQESNYSPIKGMVHKYYGRALLLITDDCPINCRFCFRRHTRCQIEDWPLVFAYLKTQSSISEIILSGGEPLLWSDKDLANLLKKLQAIEHIKRVRIHTRMPVVMPQRITSGLIKALSSAPDLKLSVVLHCNHPLEINNDVAKAVASLRKAATAVLNQTVLLRGINDNVEVLSALSEKLFANGVLPYYLHLLDKVKGAAHFEVSEESAKKIILELAARLPGYLLPKLVRDEVGAKNKTLCMAT